MIIKVKIKATHESKNSDNYTFDPIKVSHYKGEMTEEEIRGQIKDGSNMLVMRVSEEKQVKRRAIMLVIVPDDIQFTEIENLIEVWYKENHKTYDWWGGLFKKWEGVIPEKAL